MVECAFDVREEHADFAVVFEFMEPGVDEKCYEVVRAVLFFESPLGVSERVRGVEEGEKWYCKEVFSHFGKNGCEVHTAVVVCVVGRAFFVQWRYPVKFPESWPRCSQEKFACKESDGESESGGRVFEDVGGEEVGSGCFGDVQ